MKINIIGDIFGTTGYSSHTRNLANASYKLNSDIKLDVPLPPDWLRLVSDAELDMIKKPYRVADVTIGILTPPFGRIVLGDNTKKYIQYVVWEGSNIPKYWIPYLLDERVNQVWVPSNHTKDAILKTAWDYEKSICKTAIMQFFESKIKIVPHGVDLSIFKIMEVKRDNKFCFVCNKGWRGTSWDRGGVQYLVRAFSEEFKKNENVQLFLKLNSSYIHPSQVIPALNNLNLPQDRAEIKLFFDNIPYNKLPEIYCQGDVYVCPTRAEAFDLGSIEAMACGLPVITTNYGGQIEHMTDESASFVVYNLEEVKEDIMYEGCKWATPNIEDLRKRMRYCFNNKEEIKEKGKQALAEVKNWTWDISAQKALSFLKELT